MFNNTVNFNIDPFHEMPRLGKMVGLKITGFISAVMMIVMLCN